MWNRVDIHHHVGELSVGGAVADKPWSLEADIDARRGLMRRFGVDAAVLMPAFQFSRARGTEDVSRVNDIIAEYQRLDVGSFPVALGTVDPLMGEKEGIKEMHRMKDRLGMRGIVWHHRFQNVYMSDERMRPYLGQARKFGWPVFMHLYAESTMESPWALEKWAREYPDVTFVALDSLMAFTQSRYLIALGARFENIVFETAGSFGIGRLIREFVLELGSDRVVFGSDLYMTPQTYDAPFSMLEIEYSDLSAKQKQDIFVGNFRRLFGELN